jgi:hypothetical protein
VGVCGELGADEGVLGVDGVIGAAGAPAPPVGVTGGVVGSPTVEGLDVSALSSPQAEHRSNIAAIGSAGNESDSYFMIVPCVERFFATVPVHVYRCTELRSIAKQTLS